jgi:hypothetical protein
MVLSKQFMGLAHATCLSCYCSLCLEASTGEEEGEEVRQEEGQLSKGDFECYVSVVTCYSIFCWTCHMVFVGELLILMNGQLQYWISYLMLYMLVAYF